LTDQGRRIDCIVKMPLKKPEIPLTARQARLAEESSPAFYAGRKLGEKEKALLWQWLQDDPECASRELQAKLAQAQPAVSESLRHLNRLRTQWRLNRSKDRARQAKASPSTSVTPPG
jgi:hypothetical protein